MTSISRKEIDARLDALAKPKGSLGRLERLAARLAETQNTLAPKTGPRQALIFAGDHGVVQSGVGIWPSEVTGAMLSIIAGGRAASSALAAATQTPLRLIDVGSAYRGVIASQIYEDRRDGRRGTANLATGPAMTVQDFHASWAAGEAGLMEAVAAGARVVALGEIGIGNTTPAACLIALLTEADADALVGPGAGATPETLAQKKVVVREAAERARALFKSDPEAAIASVSGYEIVAMAGCIAAAARMGTTIVLDGVVSAAAALVAQNRNPFSISTVIAAHRGAEPAHAVALGKLGLEPFLEWELRLGEGTGALLLLPLLDAAAALLTDVATLAEVTG